MHAFGHCGLNLTAVAKGHEDSPPVKKLVASLLRHGASQFADSQVLEIGDLESRGLNTRSFVAFSAGTTHPELLGAFGFRTVHSHLNPHGEKVSWMMFVPGRDVEIFERGTSTPRVTPQAHPTVQLIDTPRRLEEARAVIAKEWGDGAGVNFCEEYGILQSMPGSAMYGVVENEKTIAVGAIIKALHHDEAWSRAWIVVDPQHRGGGVAERLIRGLLQHADDWHRAKDLGVMVMEGFSFVPEYYERFGTVTVARATQQSLDHRHPTWTMRITDPRSVS
jgi:GNAT superfamily N-acetyltransferase